MASEFIYTNPEAAKQAIAKLQLQAALAENTTREAIAREQTNAQRYATQSQISEREKDRQVSRDSIASQERWRGGYGSNAAANERANTQYQTILSEIKASGSDPMTKRELEARLAQFPQITEDLANNLRSERDIAYRAAKAAYDMGEGLAANYRTRIDRNKAGPAALEPIYVEIGKDQNVTLDRATGTVRSRFPMPREDMAEAGPLPSTVPSRSNMFNSPVTTIGDMKARVTGAPVGISPAQDYGGAARSVPLSAISPAQDYGGAGLPSISPAQDYGGAAPTLSTMGYPAQPPDFMDNYRAYATPTRPLYGPANTPVQNPYESVVARNPFSLGLMSIPAPQPVHPFMDMSEPYRQPSIYELYGPPNNMPYMGNDYPPRVRRSADFAVPPYMQTLPRLWDMQNIRPEFRPPLDGYYPMQ